MESKVLIKLYKELEKLVDDDEILHDTWRAKNWKARFKNIPLKKSAVGGRKNWEGGVRENLKVKLDRQLELFNRLLYNPPSSMPQDQDSATNEQLGERLLEENEKLRRKMSQKQREIKRKEEELQKEMEKFKNAVSTHFNKWIEQTHNKGWLTVMRNRLSYAICYLFK